MGDSASTVAEDRKRAMKEQARLLGLERMRKREEEANKRERAAFIKAAEMAAAKNEGINPQIFKDIIQKFSDREEAFRKAVQKAAETPQDDQSFRREITEINERHQNGIRDEIFQKYAVGDEGKKAWEAMGKELEPEGWINSVVKKLYNTEKGGFQFGGVIGGALVGILGFNVLNNMIGEEMGFLGKVLLYAGTAAVAVLGMTIGNRAFDPADRPLNVPDFHSKDEEGRAKGKAKEKDGEPTPDPEAARKAAAGVKKDGVGGGTEEVDPVAPAGARAGGVRKR